MDDRKESSEKGQYLNNLLNQELNRIKKIKKNNAFQDIDTLLSSTNKSKERTISKENVE